MSLRSDLLALAYRAITATDAELSEPITVTISSADGAASVTVVSRPGEIATFRRAADLPEMHRNILQALAENGRDVDTEELADLAGYKNNSRFRQAVSDLQRREPPLIERAGGLIRLSPTP